LLNTKQNIGIGNFYTHYKYSTKQYGVVGLAINTQKEEKAEIVVICKSLYINEDFLWSRPIKNWLETLEIDGKKVQRFFNIEG
jgi:hypothetical protein